MSLEEFAADLAAVLKASPAAAGRPLRWTIIANPKAGGFTIKRRWAVHLAVLSALAADAQKRPPRAFGAEPSRTARELDAVSGGLGALGLVPTLRPSHAGEIVRALIDEASAASPPLAELTASAENIAAGAPAPFYLVITAGGDGTSLEALTALYGLPDRLRSSFAILRLPMGTGNDGADARGLGDALKLLVEPSRLEWMPAVRLRTATAGKGPFLAFNILSIGLDAFVTHMTNRMKGALPGDSYKLWVDLATLFYDRVYRVEPMALRASAADGRPVELGGGGAAAPAVAPGSLREKLLLVAMGVSGDRTYGSNKRILPDARNVCAVPQMSLLRKLQLKPRLVSGKHADLQEIRLFSADRLDIDYGYPILAQMDGEAIRLEPADFPIAIERTEARIPVLRFL
jgi:diacylglycerol kinase family enzyme